MGSSAAARTAFAAAKKSGTCTFKGPSAGHAPLMLPLPMPRSLERWPATATPMRCGPACACSCARLAWPHLPVRSGMPAAACRQGPAQTRLNSIPCCSAGRVLCAPCRAMLVPQPVAFAPLSAPCRPPLVLAVHLAAAHVACQTLSRASGDSTWRATLVVVQSFLPASLETRARMYSPASSSQTI